MKIMIMLITAVTDVWQPVIVQYVIFSKGKLLNVCCRITTTPSSLHFDGNCPRLFLNWCLSFVDGFGGLLEFVVHELMVMIMF